MFTTMYHIATINKLIDRRAQIGNGFIEPVGVDVNDPGVSTDDEYIFEECDDGNSNDNDGCKNDCTQGSTSSNMQLSGAGGSSSASTGTGGNTCGNSKLDAGEQCDDGNMVDTDACHNNCTTNASSKCGNGMVDAADGEQCDDGNKVPDDACTNLCTTPKCGDGIIQMGEDCDDGKNNGEFGSKCPVDCKNPKMATASTMGCNQTKTFAAVVSNNQDPKIMGNGIASKWTYAGLEGLQAGTAMCQAVGADHVCTYQEVVKAEANGELANLPDKPYWLHRTTTVPNVTKNIACNADTDCAGGTGAPYCDPVTKKCGWKPGAGGRCNDWTYPTDHISDGEWFEKVKANSSTTSVVIGSLAYHFDGDTYYSGQAADSGPHMCKGSNVPGCAGGCNGGGARSILCCVAACP